VAEMDEGGHVIPYEHFSVIMHNRRRLALMTASNVDGSEEGKKPEPGRNYSRKGLSGLGKNDFEKWVREPRLDAALQLPDKFYTRDRGNFDKGHIVRRDDVAWGEDYDEVRRANGDTYHVTNCSPQVDAFNRSNLRGDWGKLENYILKQGKIEKLCLFAGPVLDDDNDKIFRGKDDQGSVKVQIPSLFWKVVVARNGDRLETFGFLLEQDLSDAEVEFNVSAEWQGKLISIAELEDLLPDIEFPDDMRESDQADQSSGENIRKSASLECYGR
jgi:endonuclease G